MNNLKKFKDYFGMNENKTFQFPFSLNLADGILTVTVDDVSAKVKVDPNSSIRKARVMSTKADIDVDVYQINFSTLRRALLEKGIDTVVLDNEGNNLKDGETTYSGDVYLVLSLPKGGSGNIKYLSKAIGRTSGGTKIVGQYDTTWGFYKMPDTEGLDGGKEINPYRKAKFVKKVEAVPVKVVVDTPFDFDSAELKFDAQNKIKEELTKVGNKNVKIVIDTGASLDGDPTEKSGKKIKGEEVTRQEWDYYLTKKRYQAVVKFIKSLGFNTVMVRRSPKSSEDVKNIYGKFNKDKKSAENRQVLIKTQYAKK
jgi:hypothetical protein